MRHAPGD